MAKYEIHCGCGHTSEIQLGGPMAERSRRITWMESPTGKCNPCYAASKRADEAHLRTGEAAKLAATIKAHPDHSETALAGLEARAREAIAAGFLAGSPATKAHLTLAAIELIRNEEREE
jgi:hypothetical protein